MSLIFAALKKLETPAQAATAPHAYAPVQMRWQPWVLPATTAAAGLLVGVGLFAVLRPAADVDMHAKASVAPSATPVASAIREVAVAAAAVSTAVATTEVAPTTTDRNQSADALAATATTAPATSAPAAGNDRSVAAVAAPAPVLPVAAATLTPITDAATNAPTPAATASSTAVAETSTAVPATANVAHAPAPSAAQEPATPAPPLTAEIHVTDRSDLAPAEGQDVARLVAAIGNALQAGDVTQAHAQLAQLARHLPPRSLTLLRMQAWVAHESGDTAAALAYYRQIVERVPGDQATVINLAMLEARNGQVDSARDRLRRLRTLAPGSNEIEKAIAMVEARLQ